MFATYCCLNQDVMALSEVVFSKHVAVTLAGAPCGVDINIQRSYAATIEFIYCGKPYTFNATKWRSSGMSRFISLFYAPVLARDATVFGTATFDAEGQIISQPSQAQKFEAIAQACVDVLATLDLILVKYGRSVLDYAVWFRETRPSEATYREYIAVIACHSIVHSNFLAPGVTWDVVTLPL